MYTEQLSQALSVAGAPIHAQTLNNASAQTGAVDMQKFHRALFLLDVGTTGSGFSVTAKLQESADNSTWFDLAGSTITAVVATSKVVTLEARAEQLTSTVSPPRRYLRCVVSETAGQAVVVCVLPLGGEGVQKPASLNDNVSVAQRLVM